MTVQVFVDTVLLSWHDPREMAASFPAVMWFWLPFGLLQVTAGYTSTFVAQYTGADRPQRVGPAVWQGIHFAVLAGLLFLLIVPAAPFLIALGGHSRGAAGAGGRSTCAAWLRRHCRCWSWPRSTASSPAAARPGRCSASRRSARRSTSLLALVLIFGRAGFPEMGIAGAGLGDGGRVVGVGPARRRRCCCGRSYRARVRHARRLAAGARAVRPADEVTAARPGCRCSSTCWSSTCSRSWSAGSARRPWARPR